MTKIKICAALLALLLAALLAAGSLDSSLLKWKPVRMHFNSSSLTVYERQLVGKLAAAGRAMDAAYWAQTDPEGYRLMNSAHDARLVRFLRINGCRWDLLDNYSPLPGLGKLPPGRSLYPAGWTRQRIEAYAAGHPEEHEAIYSPFTVVRENQGRLETVPYSRAYSGQMAAAAAALRDAAAVAPDRQFARFLELRAAALLKDDYLESDLAWVDSADAKFDIVLGPYETYLDDVLGVKTSFSAAVVMRNQVESGKLKIYQRHLPALADALPVASLARADRMATFAPMSVVDALYRGGDLTHGYQAVAVTLPNDPRVLERKGGKKIFFKNFMDARVNFVILPLSRQMMPADQASKVTSDAYLTSTVMHEIAHGLGPAYARTDGRRVPVNEALGPASSALDEAMADVVGMFSVEWLMRHGVLPKGKAHEYWASYLAGILRSVRFGVAEAHGKAEIVEFNFLAERGVFRSQGHQYSVDYGGIPLAIAELAKELLEIEGTGDRARGEALLARYGSMPAHLEAALKMVKNVPVDIDPVFDF